MLSHTQIEQILTCLPQRTIGVLGDLFLDRYLDIELELSERSIETGLTAYQVVRVRAYPGAAGTVINNLASLGVGRIYPISFIGDDGEGYELRQALQHLPAVDLGGLTLVANRRTPTYTKPMVGQDEISRFDIKNREPTPNAVQNSLLESLEMVWPRLDALLVLDQVSEADCGVVTQRVRQRIATLAGADPTKFVLADSRERIGEFRNVCVKPNADECMKAVANHTPGLHAIASAAQSLAAIINQSVFCTNGSVGIYLAKAVAEQEAPELIRACPVSGSIDICGAGDSCSAGIAAAVVAGLTHEDAAAFGNLVASITIQQLGVTGTATPEQVRRRGRELLQGVI